jgi:hypothetical protein
LVEEQECVPIDSFLLGGRNRAASESYEKLEHGVLPGS